MSDSSDGLKTLQSLKGRAHVARLLGISSTRLNYLLYALSTQQRYRRFSIKKRNGGEREIAAPILPLKRAQAKIGALLDACYAPRACVFGYVKKKSIQMNADRHVDKRWTLRVDLKSFFPSINFGRVRGMFKAKPFSLPEPVATTLAQLCCDKNEPPCANKA